MCHSSFHRIHYVWMIRSDEMITVNLVEIEDMMFTAIRVELHKTNLLIVAIESGYIMCAALDVQILDEKLEDRHVIAGRADGVRASDDLVYAALESSTEAAEAEGWQVGMTGKEALLKIA